MVSNSQNLDPSPNRQDELSEKLDYHGFFKAQIEGEVDWEVRLKKILEWIEEAKSGSFEAIEYLEIWASDPLSYVPSTALAWKKTIDIIVRNEIMGDVCVNWYKIALKNSWKFYSRDMDQLLWSRFIISKPFLYSDTLRCIANLHAFYSDPIKNKKNFQEVFSIIHKNDLSLVGNLGDLCTELSKIDNSLQTKLFVSTLKVHFFTEKLEHHEFLVWLKYNKDSLHTLDFEKLVANKLIESYLKEELILFDLFRKKSFSKMHEDLFLSLPEMNRLHIKNILVFLKESEEIELESLSGSWPKIYLGTDSKPEIFEKFARCLWKIYSIPEQNFLAKCFLASLKSKLEEPELGNLINSPGRMYYKLPPKLLDEFVVLAEIISTQKIDSRFKKAIKVYKRNCLNECRNYYHAVFNFIEWITKVDDWQYDYRKLLVFDPSISNQNISRPSFLLRSFWARLTFLLCPDLKLIAANLVDCPENIKKFHQAFLLSDEFHYLREIKGFEEPRSSEQN